MTGALQVPTSKQHTVSRVLLRQFAERGELSVFDRHRGTVKRKGPNAIFHDQLDKHDPWGAEARWGEVERKMRRVYGLVHQRSLLNDVAAVDTLRDFVAVHWIRTPAFREPHERIRRDVVAQSIARLDQDPELLRYGMKQVTGLVPAGPAGLAAFNRRLHAQVFKDSTDELLSWSLARLYEGARAILAGLELQIGYSDHEDFMIGDAPVIVRKPGHDGAGLHQGVALGDACEIAMPIAPNVIISFGEEPAMFSIDDGLVLRHNAFQAQTFLRWIACRPGGSSDSTIMANLPTKPLVN